MAELDVGQTTVTDMTGGVKDYSVDTRTTDAAMDQKETYWDNSKASQYLGYYKEIPELKKAIDALAMWTSGKGWTSNTSNTPILEQMDGWGEDTFESICNNLIICKKIYGDAFAEIIRNPKTGTLLNIKVINPADITIVANKKGRIKRYEIKGKNKIFQPDQILHLCNSRVADEIHGVSEIEAVEKVILMRNEAMEDYRRILHRSTVRIMEVDEDNPTKLTAIKTQYKDAINKGELMLIPKGASTPPIDLTPPAGDTFLSWIKYHENFFYIALGIPKVVLGGSEEFTEASAKIGYLTFEQVYSKEQRELEADLWNQVAVKVTFSKPASLKSEMLSSEDKTKEQVGFQPNDTEAGVGK